MCVCVCVALLVYDYVCVCDGVWVWRHYCYPCVWWCVIRCACALCVCVCPVCVCVCRTEGGHGSRLATAVRQQYLTPLFPSGCIFKFVLLTTWGDPHYIGLNGLELYDESGTRVSGRCLCACFVSVGPMGTER
jgi:hypothetical protein